MQADDGDIDGGHCVCDMIDTLGDFDRYLLVGVPPERLDDFRIGKVDLRTLPLETPDGEWFITGADGIPTPVGALAAVPSGNRIPDLLRVETD